MWDFITHMAILKAYATQLHFLQIMVTSYDY